MKNQDYNCFAGKYLPVLHEIFFIYRNPYSKIFLTGTFYLSTDFQFFAAHFATNYLLICAKKYFI